MVENAASEPPRRLVSARLLWVTWLFGPASYGLAFVCYVIAPEWFYGYSDPGPDLLLAAIMVMTHLVALTCTVLLLLARGPHWRAAEFWVLLIYWAGIAGWILPAFWLSAGGCAIDPTIPWLCTRVNLVAVVLMPCVGLARRAMGVQDAV